jgi:electron transport complex protein RnfC
VSRVRDFHGKATAMLQRLFSFKGGVKPQTHKTPSVQEPIAMAPLPSRLYVPLHQSIGGAANPLVEVGERVRKGQVIGGADAWLSAAAHASTSGTVLAIEEHVAAHPSGLPTLSVVIEPDGRDEWVERTPLDHRSCRPSRSARRFVTPASSASAGRFFRVTPSSRRPQAWPWKNWSSTAPSASPT